MIPSEIRVNSCGSPHAMIVYPVQYNRNDECVEDAELKVLAHPFATIEEGKEIKHERGAIIALAINAYVPGESPKSMPVVKDYILPSQSIYDLTEKVYAELPYTQKQKLIRIERKHKKLVAKLTARAVQDAKLEGGNNG